MVSILMIFFTGATLIFGGLETRTRAFVFSLLGVLLGASVFTKTAIMLHLFTIREWLLLPWGVKILRIGGKSNEDR
ncbi:hypothetical protein TMU3MR103_2095 [Tetragenococcus muriaticus 3MR10-3]|uniref:Uncharacterized protein n=2 Tax=Tetragenococcus muriaticus TaxID=64642 RepID=A0A091BUA8_9ENTE|nr:hypothetical protein TMU3MR103_2095 [Tetragenococcus muriaticus 3MR10-3]